MKLNNAFSLALLLCTPVALMNAQPVKYVKSAEEYNAIIQNNKSGYVTFVFSNGVPENIKQVLTTLAYRNKTTSIVSVDTQATPNALTVSHDIKSVPFISHFYNGKFIGTQQISSVNLLPISPSSSQK
jgi:hypothetical protein